MRTFPLTSFLAALAAISAQAQVLPDRHVVVDPLGSGGSDTAGVTWLSAPRLHAEFSLTMETNGEQRWNARTGGMADVVRWDSVASIAVVGTMEVIVDPNNDIAFNPRAIFWEEGVVATFRIGASESLQAGYVHRCKHDIDNAELIRRGGLEQRTLIYSGLLTRLNLRPRPIVGGDWTLSAGGSVRNDLFLHLLDDRLGLGGEPNGRDVERMIDALTFGFALELQPAGIPAAVSLGGSAMATFVGAEPGFTERFSGVTVLGSMPFIELGVRFFRRDGAAWTVFARAEWQRDAGIREHPAGARMLMIGLRIADRETAGG